MRKAVDIRVVLAVLSAAVLLRAQAPPVDARASTQAPVAQQNVAAKSMEESLARQRASVQQQTGQAEPGAFFLLGPPARLGAVAPLAPAAADCQPLPSSEVDRLVEKAAKQEDVDKDTLRAVMQQESAFRPCSVSPKGAMGLMQLMPATASQFGVSDPFDNERNVEAGATFLKQLLVRYGGDLTLALGAYNAGPAKVDASGGVPDIPETQNYIKQILPVPPVKQ